MIFDDHKVPRRAFEEIEAEADRARSFAEGDKDGRIDLFQLLSALGIKLVVKSDAVMGDHEAYAMADKRQIWCRRIVSQGLRFGNPQMRHLVAHELGHIFLHRGSAPKARKVGGNRELSFVPKKESAERQAWMFARALFVTRFDLTSGESDEELGVRVGLATGPVSLRREEVRSAIQAALPKPKLPESFLKETLDLLNQASRTIEERPFQSEEMTRQAGAWSRAAQILGEDPARVRSARGFRVEWDYYGRPESQVGWTVHNGEARSFMDLRSR